MLLHTSTHGFVYGGKWAMPVLLGSTRKSLQKKRGSVDIVKDVSLKSYPVPQKVKAGRGGPVDITLLRLKI